MQTINDGNSLLIRRVFLVEDQIKVDGFVARTPKIPKVSSCAHKQNTDTRDWIDTAGHEGEPKVILGIAQRMQFLKALLPIYCFQTTMFFVYVHARLNNSGKVSLT